MKFGSCLTAVMLATLLAGCVTTRASLTPQPANDQRIAYKNDMPMLRADRTHGYAVAVKPVYELKDEQNPRIAIQVEVLNRSGQPVDFSADNVLAITEDGVNCPVIPYQTLVEEERSSANFMMAMQAISGAANQMNASQAGKSYSYGSASAMGSNGSWASGTWSGTRYDQGKAMEAQDRVAQQTQADIKGTRASADKRINSLQSLALKRNTVEPGKVAGGVVVLQMPPPNDTARLVTVTVRVGEEALPFNFLYGRIRKGS